MFEAQVMAQVYFCGTDVYNLLQIGSDSSSKRKYFQPVLLQNISKVDYYNHFMAIYQRGLDWFVNAVGLGEIELFPASHRIIQVAASSDTIIGLSEDGELFRTVMNCDSSEGQSSIKLSEIVHIKFNEVVKRIASNDGNIYGLQSSLEVSRIYQVTKEIECIAEFRGQRLIDISVGNGHFVALSDTGAAFNWGHSGRSELYCGNDTTISPMKACEKPIRVDFFDDLPCIVTKIACGGWHTMALTSDGDIYSWGWNESGQLGYASGPDNSIPHPVDLGSAEDPIVDIAAGSKHSVALLKSGKVYSWGRKNEGQLGYNSDLESVTNPEKMITSWDGNGKACKIKCGDWSTFVLTS